MIYHYFTTFQKECFPSIGYPSDQPFKMTGSVFMTTISMEESDPKSIHSMSTKIFVHNDVLNCICRSRVGYVLKF